MRVKYDDTHSDKKFFSCYFESELLLKVNCYVSSLRGNAHETAPQYVETPTKRQRNEGID